MIEKTPETSLHMSNVQNYSAQPRNLRLTPRGVANPPLSVVYPEIRGGQCEKCGVVDAYQPAHLQYKLCEHYRGMEMRCIYCKEDKNPEEVLRHSKLIVRSHPFRPGEMVTMCGAFDCKRKFEEEFGS